MKVLHGPLAGLIIFEPRVFADSRGWFMESWSERFYKERGLPQHFVQDNISSSHRGVVRGLHFQNPHAQGKLVSVLEGEVLDIALDIRCGSPTFGKWESVILSSDNRRQLYLPPGFAHGFQVISEKALFYYKCTDAYHPECEQTILCNDPDLSISWPIRPVEISDKDGAAKPLKSFGPEKLTSWSND